MSHLIQSIDIDGTRYCVKHGASTPKWRTVSLLSDAAELTGAEDADMWRVPNPDGANETVNGEIRFATCCVWKFTLRATSSNPDSEKGIFVYANDVLVESVIFYDEVQVETVIDLNALGLMERPCGNLWRIQAGFAYSFEDELLEIDIVDVTFGPPV